MSGKQNESDPNYSHSTTVDEIGVVEVLSVVWGEVVNSRFYYSGITYCYRCGDPITEYLHGQSLVGPS